MAVSDIMHYTADLLVSDGYLHKLNARAQFFCGANSQVLRTEAPFSIDPVANRDLSTCPYASSSTWWSVGSPGCSKRSLRRGSYSVRTEEARFKKSRLTPNCHYICNAEQLQGPTVNELTPEEQKERVRQYGERLYRWDKQEWNDLRETLGKSWVIVPYQRPPFARCPDSQFPAESHSSAPTGETPSSPSSASSPRKLLELCE
jgi:hypothetical protein